MALLRSAVSSDEPFVLALTPRLAAFEIPAWRTADEIAVSDHPILLEALHRPSKGTAIIVAEDPPGTPVGYVFATTKTNYFTGKPLAHIEILALVPTAEGRGLARQLMDAIEQWAAQLGYSEITLNVFETNYRARAVYDRLGYQPELMRYRKSLGQPLS